MPSAVRFAAGGRFGVGLTSQESRNAGETTHARDFVRSIAWKAGDSADARACPRRIARGAGVLGGLGDRPLGARAFERAGVCPTGWLHERRQCDRASARTPSARTGG